jgi:hypothetical protein
MNTFVTELATPNGTDKLMHVLDNSGTLRHWSYDTAPMGVSVKEVDGVPKLKWTINQGLPNSEDILQDLTTTESWDDLLCCIPVEVISYLGTLKDYE